MVRGRSLESLAIICFVIFSDIFALVVDCRSTGTRSIENNSRSNISPSKSSQHQKQRGQSKKDDTIRLMLNLPYHLTSSTRRKYHGSGYNMGPYYASAAMVAAEDINRDKNLLGDNKLRVLYDPVLSDTKCSKRQSIRSLLKQINQQRPHGYIGYKCHCSTVASILSAINRPLISHGCVEPELSNKIHYPTFARTTTLNPGIPYMLMEFLNKYDWKKFAVLYENNHLWSSIHDALKKEVQNSPTLNITYSKNYIKSDAYTHERESLDHIFKPFLDELPKKAQVVLLMMDKGFLQQFMLLAAQKNLTNGDYVFIAVHPFATMETILRSKSFIRDYVWVLPWIKSRETKSLLMAPQPVLEKAFQSLFVLMPQFQDVESNDYKKFEHFQNQVREGMEEEPFNSYVYVGIIKHTSKRKNTTKPPPEAHQLYDAVKLYGYGLNKTIAKGYSVTNGTDIILNILNTEHKSITGSAFTINCHGDVQVSYQMKQFQFDADKNVKHWLPKVVFDFKEKLTSCDGGEKRPSYAIKDGEYKVKWVAGKPPTDK